MQQYLKAFILAWNLLTIIPLPSDYEITKRHAALSLLFYPLVGAILGAMLYLLYAPLALLFGALHAKVVLLALWVLLSGALHLDGLVDTVDALYAPKERALEVLKDSRIGAMGMLYGALFLLLKGSALSALGELSYLVPILMLARLGGVIAIYAAPYISSGLGVLFREHRSTRLLVVCLLYSAAAALLFDAFLLYVVLLAFSYAVAGLLSRRFGGLNGDMYGFIIETSELLLLHIALLL